MRVLRVVLAIAAACIRPAGSLMTGRQQILARVRRHLSAWRAASSSSSASAASPLHSLSLLQLAAVARQRGPWHRPPPLPFITPVSLEPSFGSSILNNRFFQTPPPAMGYENIGPKIGGPAVSSKGRVGPYAPWRPTMPDPMDVGWRESKEAGPQFKFDMSGIAGGGPMYPNRNHPGDHGYNMPGSSLPYSGNTPGANLAAAGSEYTDTWYPDHAGSAKYQVDKKDPGADVRAGEIPDNQYPIGGHETKNSMLNIYAEGKGAKDGVLGMSSPGVEVMGELPSMGRAPPSAGF